jgi:hypothetical protein
VKIENKILLVGLLIAFTSCTINQKIAYSTKDIKAKSSPITNNLIISIDLLEDNRMQNSENSILFQNPRQVKLDGQMSCINSEEHYKDKKNPVNQQITHALINHLRAEKQYKGIRFAKRDSIDFYLTGKISHFYSKQGFSTIALVGTQFGLIGAVATAGAKTGGIIKIVLSDVKIIHRSGQVAKEIGTIEKKFEGSLNADAYCWCSYININYTLKDFNSELSETLQNNFKEILNK